MKYGDRLKAAIRGRVKRTSELANAEARQRRSYEWRKRRTAELLRAYRRSKTAANLRNYRTSRALVEKSRKATMKAHDATQASRRKLATWRRKLASYRRRLRAAASNRLWGGSRAVTNEVINIVGGRAPITSRKRWELFGNPDSDHYMGKRNADAVDFGITNAHWLKNEISRRLGGPSSLADYGSFNIRRRGKTYRVQIIAGTHGTGPHLHVGVERV